MTRRTALLEIDAEGLRQLLHLPEGVEVTGIEDCIGLRGVTRVRITGAGWLVNEGDIIPTTRAIVTTVTSTAGESRIAGVNWGFPS